MNIIMLNPTIRIPHEPFIPWKPQKGRWVPYAQTMKTRRIKPCLIIRKPYYLGA